jgi:hypothetical protein
MLSQSFFFLFSLFLCVLATVPSTVYRGDARSPAEIKQLGGFHTYAATNGLEPNHDLLLHCMGGHEDNDGFVSTSSSYQVGTRFGSKKSGWVYHIDTSSTSSQYTDVQAWCKENNHKNPIPKEKEWSCKGTISWFNIVSWDKVEKNKVVSSQTRAAFDAAGGSSSRPSSSGKGSAKGSKSPKRSETMRIRGATREEITDLIY